MKIQKKASENSKRVLDFGFGSGNKELTCEVFDSSIQLQLGLMYRDKLDENNGALFIFPEADYLGMWMKNVKIPLAVCFFTESKKPNHYRIVDIQKMEQGNESKIYRSPERIRYAVEANIDFFDKNKINAGDTFIMLT